MGVDTSLQYNGYNSYKFNQNDFLICYPFGVENMEYITHSFGAYSPIALSAKVRAYTRFFNVDGEEIKLENHSFAVQQGTFDKVEITVSVPSLAVKAELKFLNNEAQPWWVATPKTEEGQNATPYAINAYGQLTYITPNGIYTGTITANQIVLASGNENLSERLTTINANQIQLEDLVNQKTTKITANGVYTGEIVADQVDFDGAKGNNVDLTGKITATSGKIGGYDISGDNLIGNNVVLGRDQIQIRQAIIKGLSDDANTVAIESRYLQLGDPEQNINFITFAGEDLIRGSTSMGYRLYVSQVLPDTFSEAFEKNLGNSSSRWDYAYLKNQPNVSSDIRIKNNIQEIPKDLICYLKEIKPKMYEMNNRIHFGYIAQDVERALYKYALKTVGFKKAWEFVKKHAVLYKDESYLSLLYGEITVLKEAEMQREIDDLEERISKLENIIKEGDK